MEKEKELVAKKKETEKRVEEEIRKIITRGYAIEDREVNSNVRGLAVPFFDATGELVAAVGILAPANLLTVAQTPLLSRQLKVATRKLYDTAVLSMTEKSER